MRRARATLIMLSFGLASIAASAAEPVAKTPDEDALWAKKSAAQAISDMLAKPGRSVKQQLALLLRYSEILQEVATIRYRVSYAHAGNTQPPDLIEYRSTLQQSITPLNKVITQLPSSDVELAHAYHLRSKAYFELGAKDLALVDLKHLIDTWPKAREAPLANLSLWELMTERKDYAGVIHYVMRWGLKPGDKLYGIALEKLAWSYYLLNDTLSALKYAEVAANHYAWLKKTGHDRSADREKTMSNLALFYATGVAAKLPATPAAGVLLYFKKFYAGPELEKIFIQYGYVLRTKGLDTEIEDLQQISANEPLSDGFRSDLLLLTYEHQMNRQRFAQLQSTSQAEIALFAKSATLKKDEKRSAQALKILAGSLPALHKELERYQGRPEAKTLSDSLINIYRFFIASASVKNIDEQAKLHYNLAELLSQMGNLEPSALEYRWIVDHYSLKNPTHQKMHLDASLKSISGRYNTLKQLGLIPKDLTAKNLHSQLRPLPENVSQWVNWVDRLKASFPVEKETDTLYFEANRTLYFLDQVPLATQRLLEFVKKFPTSPQAIPSASLVIDTYIASEQWADTCKIAQDLQKIKEWKEPDFHTRLEVIEADSYFKDVEYVYKKKDYAEVLKKVDAFLALKPQSKRTPDLLEIAANAELASHDNRGAMKYFASLAKLSQTLKPQTQATIAVTSASVAESIYDFGAALTGLRHYLTLLGTNKTLDQSNLEKTREKTLYSAWINGQSSELEETLKQPGICSPGLAATCARYRLLSKLLSTEISDDSKDFRLAQLKSSRKLTPDRAIWAALALKNTLKVPYQERYQLLQTLIEQWDSEDPIVQYTMLPVLIQGGQEVLKSTREKVRTGARVRLDRGSIARRVKLMKEAEERMSRLAVTPWQGIRIQSLFETGGLYHDLSAELGGLPSPEGLAGDDLASYRKTIDEIKTPFDKKAEASDRQAVELLARLKIPEYALDPANNPTISAAWLLPLLGDGSDQSKNLLHAFAEAVEKGNWPRIAFLVQESKTPKLFPEGSTSLFESVSLAKAGAIPESLGILHDTFAKADRKTKAALLLMERQWSGPVRAPAHVLPTPVPSAIPSPLPSVLPSAAPSTVPSPAKAVKSE